MAVRASQESTSSSARADLQDALAAIVRRAELRAVASGGVGGLVMALYEMVAIGLTGPGFLHPIDLIAASVDEMKLPFPIVGGVRLAVGVLLHTITAGFWGHKYGSVLEVLGLPPRTILQTVLAGVVWGAIVWLLMGLIVGPTLDPAMRDAQPVHYFVGHLAYGVVTALTFRALRRRAEEHDGRGVTAAPQSASRSSRMRTTVTTRESNASGGRTRSSA